jgi:hypothetical protein
MEENTLFDDECTKITFDGTSYYIYADTGEAVGSYIKKSKITKSQAERAMSSEEGAYRVLLEVDSQ